MATEIDARPEVPALRVPAAARTAYRATRRFRGVFIALLVMMTYLAATESAFLTTVNFSNVLRGAAVLYLVAIGNTFVLLTAGFDLSVGSQVALSGVTLAALIGAGVDPVLAIILTLVLVSILGGATNGLLIGKAKLSFFVVTLATLSIIRGGVYVATEGKTERVDASAVAELGGGKVLGIGVPILIMALVLGVSLVVLHLTRFGRAVYAVGGNAEAARLSGINVGAVLVAVYAISGLLAGLAGVIQVGRLGAAAPVAGGGIELVAAAAVLLGGTSFSGGSGGVGGTTVGVLFIAFLQNGLGLMGVSAYWQDVVTGLILIAAIGLDRLSNARSRT